MKECPSCKTKNRNDADFCIECGANLKNVPAAADEWAAAAGDFLNKAKAAATTGAKKAKEAAGAGVKALSDTEAKVQKAFSEADQKTQAKAQGSTASGGWDSAVEVQTSAAGSPKGTSSMFVDQSESVMATIGNNYLQNFLTGGKVERGVGVLTQKRFYFKGKNYTGQGKDIKSSTQEGVVSVDDIAFTQFIYTRPTGLLIAAVLLLIAGIAAFALGFDYFLMRAVGGVVTVAALFFFVRYFTSRQTLFVITFPGGRFGFDVKYYPISDIRDFQRQLHLLKDHRKEGGDA